MNTVQRNNNITKSELQEFVKKMYKEIGLTEVAKEKILKYIKQRKCTREKIKIFYSQILKIVENKENFKKGKHLTYGERIVIEVLFNAGIPNTIISLVLKKHRSTIGREVKKGKIEKEDLTCKISYKKKNCYRKIITYSAQKGNGEYLTNRANCKKKYKLLNNPKLCKIVTKLIKGIICEKTKVKIKYSPDAISNMLKLGKIKGTNEKISTTSIYNAAHSRFFEFGISDLPHGRLYYKKINMHAQYKEIKDSKKEHSIERLPENVKNKESITHFEGDSIIGKREGKNNTLITLVNTSSKFLIVERAKDKTSKSFVEVLNKLEKEIKEMDKIMETLLLDNGCEFSDIQGIENSSKNKDQKRLSVYYAHPYTSCERGCNENKNRDVRKDFPKGKLVEDLKDLDILNISRRINNTPRKVLGWKTALEVFEEQLKTKNISTEFLDKYRIENSKYILA